MVSKGNVCHPTEAAKELDDVITIAMPCRPVHNPVAAVEAATSLVKHHDPRQAICAAPAASWANSRRGFRSLYPKHKVENSTKPLPLWTRGNRYVWLALPKWRHWALILANYKDAQASATWLIFASSSSELPQPE